VIGIDKITAEKRKEVCMEVNALRMVALKAVSLIAEVLSDVARAEMYRRLYKDLSLILSRSEAL